MGYNKLWKLLIVKNMKKSDSQKMLGAVLFPAKLGKNDNVAREVLMKNCNEVKCDVGDIMEFTSVIDTSKGSKNED